MMVDDDLLDWGCEYCRNDGQLVEGRCPRCDAEFPDEPIHWEYADAEPLSREPMTERALIVAWLRNPAGKGTDDGIDWADTFADAIEQGDHLQQPQEMGK